MREIRFSEVSSPTTDFSFEIDELFIDVRQYRLGSDRLKVYREAQGTRNRESLLHSLTNQVIEWVATDFLGKGKAACIGLATSLESDNGKLVAGILARVNWFYADGPEAVAQVWRESKERQLSMAAEHSLGRTQLEFYKIRAAHYDRLSGNRPNAPLLLPHLEG